ncbi:MAG: flavodoxin family protein [Clostridiales bacterium]|nr:flavodoxin family protein [Clostridiales bacterium]
MNILVLNGSPRMNGNTAAMVEAFIEGASENNHHITVVQVCQKKIAGCLRWRSVRRCIVTQNAWASASRS